MCSFFFRIGKKQNHFNCTICLVCIFVNVDLFFQVPLKRACKLKLNKRCVLSAVGYLEINWAATIVDLTVHRSNCIKAH